MNKFKSMLFGALALAVSSLAASAHAGDAFSPFGLRCVADATDADSTKVAESLSLRFSKVWGKDWLTKPTPPARIDPKVMEEVVAISACAAIVDCSNYFNRHIGGDLTVFTDIGPKVPLRKQFDEATAALPQSEGKSALQSCMKRQAKKMSPDRRNYDPEFGGKVSVFMDLSTKVPVRRQYCIKLVGKK